MNNNSRTNPRRITSLLLCVCLGASLVINAFPVAAQRRASAITGRVVTEDGMPRANVAIVARAVGATASTGRTQADTDAAGRFTLPDLESGAYIIEAYAPGYVLIPFATADATRTAYHRPGDSVTLTMAKGGVITGRVTNTAGEPLVRISVRAIRRRTPEGEPPTYATQYFYYNQERQTDDRGIYRIYGLQPGSYIVVAGAARQNSSPLPDAYGGLTATYHPSATSDTATEIVVSSGETTNADIVFRGEPGHTVSGTVAGAIESSARGARTQVSLINATSGILEQSAYVNTNRSAHGFSFDGVPAGEYDIVALRGGGENQRGAASLPRRITLRAADIAGIEITLLPLASVSGRLHIEPLTAALQKQETCAAARNSNAPEQVIVSALRNDATPNAAVANPSSTNRNTLPNARGEFILRDLEAGDYRIELQTPDEHLFVNAIIKAKSETAKTAAPPAPASEFALKSGDNITDISITLATGAARLSGKITSSAGKPATPRTRVYLIPLEPAHADYSWRYRSTLTAQGGAWTLTNIAPGAYRILALNAETHSPTRLTSAAQGRAELRRLAEATGTRIELAPCQNIADFALRLSGL
jgi:hypothetical protein